ncbi:MAG: PA14 domain-containing protein [Planctomycetes bacterium]|nr:PA14 domain-containing protein [Planctomycetota bacterium]
MSKRLTYLVCMAVGVLVLGTAAQAVHDVTVPGDVIIGIPNDGVSQNDDHGWPGNEPPKQAIDNQITTKYLHFKGEDEPTGFCVTPKRGPSVVTSLTFTTANDAEARDPIDWELSGSNESIDGAYTRIASGEIVDFRQGTVWPRRTKGTTAIKFANTVSYKHYKLMFPHVRDAAGANSMQIAEVELLEADLTATSPKPADGTVGVTMPLLQWTPGDVALFENVYVGTTPDLTAADLSGNHQPAMLKMHYYTKGLVPGQKYYWRVDDIDATGKVYTGTVWSFTAAPLTAYSPIPRDGDKWISVDTTLSWQPGKDAIKHDVFFGTDKAAVEARSASVAKGTVSALIFNPGALAQNTTYYWAIDETTVSGQKQAGPVWSFTTIGGGGGIRGEYFVGTNPGGVPIVSQIDTQVNVNATGTNSPVPGVPGDGWSARWTADLDIPVADTFQFSVNCQDGCRLWIDDILIIDQWIVPTVTSEYFAVPMFLDKGIHSLRLEFQDTGGDAVCQLYWSSATMAKVLVPAGPLQPPVHARTVYPPDKSVNIQQDVTLMWAAGETAKQHVVYFGEDAAAVAAADTSSSLCKGTQALAETSFTPGALAWNKTYYWRIDEVNDANPGSPWKGSVWSFTTADFLVIDNMEGYTDDEGYRIYETWIDGLFDGKSNSTVGNLNAPFAEQSRVRGGKQSMPMDYDNTKTPFISHATLEFTPTQDWTVNGVSTLVLFVSGRVTNAAESVYVVVEDSVAKSATEVNADATIITKGTWTEWKIPLSKFAGVNMARVKKLSVGVGNPKAPKAGAAGRIYVDDIGVIK